MSLVDNYVTETYCHELARIDRLGLNCRLIFTVPSVDSPNFRSVVAKLIVPLSMTRTIGMMTLGAQNDATAVLLSYEADMAN